MERMGTGKRPRPLTRKRKGVVPYRSVEATVQTIANTNDAIFAVYVPLRAPVYKTSPLLAP